MSMRKDSVISKFKKSFDNIKLNLPLDSVNYDILLEDLNVLISIDDSFDSNEVDIHANTEKSQIALNHGYRCINIFRWDDEDRIIEYLLTDREIDLSDCIMCGLSKDGAREFYEANSISDEKFESDSSTVYYGMYYKKELVFMFAVHRVKTHLMLCNMCCKLGVKVSNLRYALQRFGTFTFGCDISKSDIKYLIDEGLIYESFIEPSIHWIGDSNRSGYDCGTAVLQGNYD